MSVMHCTSLLNRSSSPWLPGLVRSHPSRLHLPPPLLSCGTYCGTRPRRTTVQRDQSGCTLTRAVGITREAPPGLRPEPWTASPEQQQALDALRLRMTKSPNGMPSDDILRWYLRDRSFDVEEAEEKLVKMLAWRKDFQPGSITPSMVQREFATGKAYLHDKTDVYGRPVIVIRAEKHVTGEFPLIDSKRLCVHLIDEAVQRLQDSSNGAQGDEVEQILGIFDLRGFSVPRNADFVFAGFMVQAFFEFYPKRVGQVLMVEAPWVFGPAWEVIKPLLRKYSSLVRFVSLQELQRDFFLPETLPQQLRR